MKKNFPYRYLRGFTLIESLFGSVIALIIISFLTMFFLSIMIGKQSTQVRQELAYNMEFVISQINSQIKQATEILELSSTLEVHPGTLSLNTIDPNQNPVVIQSNGSDLLMSIAGGDPQSLLTSKNEVTHLVFSFRTPNNSPGIVTGTITMRSLIDPEVERTETFSINLRTNVP